jgi:transposase-like protein
VVEAEILESYLRRGLSLEAIGRLTGRHPSTVGYWVKQHGLAAVNRDRHAPKGGIVKVA